MPAVALAGPRIVFSRAHLQPYQESWLQSTHKLRSPKIHGSSAAVIGGTLGEITL
jgi:hypothetical protein